MREIKFRVFDPNTNNLIDTNVGIDKISMYDFDGENITEQEGLVIMQYTGLKDKNGNEIYEGDIVEYSDYSRGLRIFGEQPKSRDVIKWRSDGTGYQLKGMGFSIKTNKCEVVGNIYENPELLEKTE